MVNRRRVSAHKRAAFAVSQMFIRYGIKPEEYVARIRAQGNKCAICRNPFPKPRLPSVDHDHKTKKVRAILCGGCNTGLGYFKESPVALRAAADYIEKHATV